MKASLLILAVSCLSFGNYTFTSYEGKAPIVERNGILVFKIIDSTNTVCLYLPAKADFKKNFGSEVINGIKIEWELSYNIDESSFFRLSKDDLSILSKSQVKKIKPFVYDVNVNLSSRNWFLPYISLIKN